MESFPTHGPVNPQRHFSVPCLDRIDHEALVAELYERRLVFFWAPPSFGMTSLWLALRDAFAERVSEGQEVFRPDPLYLDVSAAVLGDQPLEDRVLAVMTEIGLRAKVDLEEDEPFNLIEEVFGIHGPGASIRTQVQRWLLMREAPLVFLVDGLQECSAAVAALILQQLSPFHEDAAGEGLGLLIAGRGSLRWMFPEGAPPLLNRAAHFDLPGLTVTQVQQTAEVFRLKSGRTINHEAVDFIHQLTQGHPWLVNLLFEQIITLAEGETEIGGEHVAEAKEQLIGSSASPLQRWFPFCRRPGVQRVIEPLLTASTPKYFLNHRDLDEASALGLIAGFDPPRFANRLLEEWIPRRLVLGNDLFLSRHEEEIAVDGRLNFPALLSRCQSFFAGEGRGVMANMPYPDAGPLLLLQGFIARLVHNHGRIEREVDTAREMVTLFIFWKTPDGIQTVILGLKPVGAAAEVSVHRHLNQVSHYMDLCETGEGFLVLLPKGGSQPASAASMAHSAEDVDGKTVQLWRF